MSVAAAPDDSEPALADRAGPEAAEKILLRSAPRHPDYLVAMGHE